MSDGLVCDACGATLLLDSDVRYVVDVRGYAAYDPLELTEPDLARDFRSEMADLIEKLEDVDPTRAEEDVHKEWKLDLCPACWRRYVDDPLAGLREAAVRGSAEPGPLPPSGGSEASREEFGSEEEERRDEGEKKSQGN